MPKDAHVVVETEPPGGRVIGHDWIACDLLSGKYDFLRLKVLLPGGLVANKLRLTTKMSFQIAAEDIQLYDGADIGLEIRRMIEAVALVIDKFAAEFRR